MRTGIQNGNLIYHFRDGADFPLKRFLQIQKKTGLKVYEQNILLLLRRTDLKVFSSFFLFKVKNSHLPGIVFLHEPKSLH